MTQTHNLRTSRDINDAIRTQILAKQLDNEFSADVRVDGRALPVLSTMDSAGTKDSESMDIQIRVERSIVVETQSNFDPGNVEVYGMERVDSGGSNRSNGGRRYSGPRANAEWAMQTQRRLYTLPEAGWDPETAG